MIDCRGVGRLNARREDSLVKNGEIVLDGRIDPAGPISVRAVRRALGEVGCANQLHVRLASDGGEIEEARRLYILLREQDRPIIVNVEHAVSCAVLLVMAASHRTIVQTGRLMVHSPRLSFLPEQATAHELRARADLLDEMEDSLIDAFHRRTGLARDELRLMLATEMSMTAERARDLHFVDEIVPGHDRGECPLLYCPIAAIANDRLMYPRGQLE